tara:strand:- start:616 stop:1188 length:573 start_codon:yes stop_codon:yes gene_type:complete
MNSSGKSSNACKNKLLSLLVKDAYRYGDFTLASGMKSNHYINCKPVTLSGTGLQLISDLLLDYVELEAKAVAGLTLGADPLVSGVAMAAASSNRSLDALIVRKQPKGHGTQAWLEGPLPPKESLITVLEDVVTTGNSSIKAVNHLREFGYRVNKVVSIVDRQEGADLTMKNEGLLLESIFLLKDLISQSS